MASKVKDMVTYYGVLLEDHLERVERATVLGKSGSYGPDDLARDWGETATDVVTAWRRSWEMVFPNRNVEVMVSREGKKNFNHRIRLLEELTTDVMATGNLIRDSVTIPFDATVDSTNKRRVTIKIVANNDLGDAAPGAPFEGAVYKKKADGTQGDKLVSLHLLIRS